MPHHSVAALAPAAVPCAVTDDDVEAAKQRMLRVLCVLVSLPEIVAGYCPDECGGSTSVGPEAFGGAD